MVTRRLVLAGTLALASGARAQTPFAASADAARALAPLHALVILKDGEVALAEAFRGPGLNRPANIKSVSKSLVAMATGAAIDRGVLPGVSATLGEIVPKLIPRQADPQVAGLTVEHLVTLRAGLERTSGGNYGAWVSSRNWVADALSRPFVAEPGGRMLYSTGSTHVLGAVLAEAAGRSLLRLMRDWLGEPLGIEIPSWTRDPQGYYLGGNEMALTPHAMARVGEVMRLAGRWGERQVLSPEWVAESLTPRTASPFSGLGYGYGWFLGRAGGIPVALARGYGGQVIAVAPERGLTLAITSDPTQPARSEGYFGDLMRLIGRVILPEA